MRSTARRPLPATRPSRFPHHGAGAEPARGSAQGHLRTRCLSMALASRWTASAPDPPGQWLSRFGEAERSFSEARPSGREFPIAVLRKVIIWLPSVFRISSVSYNRGKSYVLDKLNLEVKDGEFCVFLGPSGCGKSTAMHCIAGLLHPVHGEIRFGDDVMTRVSEGSTGQDLCAPAGAQHRHGISGIRAVSQHDRP